MKLEDARSLAPKAQERLRKQAIQRYQEGGRQTGIAQELGVARGTVSKWWSRYRRGGVKALASKPEGRPVGAGRQLSREQEKKIRGIICKETPDQLKLDFALGTRRAVMELIGRQFEISLPVRTTGEYLKRWGFTPQKPLKQAYEQSPAQVKRWLKETYPAIKYRAAQEGAEIHWGDETGLSNHSHNTRGYAPKGKTPVLGINARGSRANMISSITHQGKVRFMICRGTMHAKVLIRFLEKLISGADRKIHLILDNLKVHHSKRVKERLADNAEGIEVHFLPSCSPELNPDEYLNCDLKAQAHSRPPVRSLEALEKRILGCMRKIQKLPARVMKYFHHPKIQYAH